MREVSVSWDREVLESTDLALLDEVVERLSFIGNLLITPEGVRQIILPVYKGGKSADDLEALPYIKIEQRVNEREGDALVVWNTHALVCLASTTENIYVMLPTEYENGELTLTVRGIPQAISSFVKLSKMILPLQAFGFEISSRRGTNSPTPSHNARGSVMPLRLNMAFTIIRRASPSRRSLMCWALLVRPTKNTFNRQKTPY